MLTQFEGWCVLELMGHRVLAGYVREVEMFGTKMCRIEIPESAEVGHPGTQAVQFYSGGSVYCLTPVPEEVARKRACPPPPPALQAYGHMDDDDDGDEIPY